MRRSGFAPGCGAAATKKPYGLVVNSASIEASL